MESLPRSVRFEYGALFDRVVTAICMGMVDEWMYLLTQQIFCLQLQQLQGSGIDKHDSALCIDSEDSLAGRFQQ